MSGRLMLISYDATGFRDCGWRVFGGLLGLLILLWCVYAIYVLHILIFNRLAKARPVDWGVKDSHFPCSVFVHF